MRIAFIVNTTGLTGGIKVIFEYANELTRRGHEVDIIHLLRLHSGLRGLLIAVLKKFKYIWLSLLNGDRIKWFKSDERVRIKHLIRLKPGLPADILIATANETTEWVNNVSTLAKKFYFVQDYEDWTRNKELVDATYHLPLIKITTCQHLHRLFKEKLNINIPNVVLYGIDAEKFACRKKIYNDQAKIFMQYHVLPKKGIENGLKAYQEAKKKFPGISLSMYGTYPLPQALRDDIKYYYQPKAEVLKKLFCETDIFLFSSLEEGFGIPPMEAMAAGCAVIATDTGAVREYAQDKETALIVPPGDEEAMTTALIKMIENIEERMRIGQAAKEAIKKFSWENSTTLLENVLKENV